MDTPHFITERVRAAVRAAFPLCFEEALSVLASAPIERGEAGETIALGLVRLARGELAALEGSVKYFDPRDAIYAFYDAEEGRRDR